MLIHQIKKKLVVTWLEDVKAIVDTWESYFVTQFEFEQAVLVKGLSHAKENGGIAWIVDSSNAIGAMPRFMIDLIDKKVFPEFAKNGIKYFITISAGATKVAQKTVAKYSEKTHHNGLKLVEVESLEDAINWLRKNAAIK
jgi:hypothetical protein